MCAEAESEMTGEASWCRCGRAERNCLSKWRGNGLRSCARAGRHWWMQLIRFWGTHGNHEEEKEPRMQLRKQCETL